jgi:hypothetical protein
VRPGIAALGAITEIDGKIKAAGKTTLLLWMVRAVLDGADFLGHPTRQSKVVYVTEQSWDSFRYALQQTGLDQRGPEFQILLREHIGATPWPEVVRQAGLDFGYDLVIFDTIGKLSGIKEENSAGEWAAAMTPLQDLAASGRSVVIARHDRKGGGEVGDSGRGSSQASGDVDIILALRRPEGHQPGARRVIESLSRYRETPEKIVVELTEEGYILLGSDEAVAAADALRFVLDYSGHPRLGVWPETNSGVAMADFEKAGTEHDPPISRSSIRRAIERLEREGRIHRTGRGVKNDPALFTLAE